MNLFKVIGHLTLASCLCTALTDVAVAAPKKASRKETVEHLMKKWDSLVQQMKDVGPEEMTAEQRKHVVMSVASLVTTRAERTDVPQECDKQYPVSSLIDLAEITSCLCSIKQMLAGTGTTCAAADSIFNDLLDGGLQAVLEIANAQSPAAVAAITDGYSVCDLLNMLLFICA